MDGVNSPYSVRLELLREELERAWQARETAIAQFHRIVQDGSFVQIQSARARMNRAVNAHSRIVKHYVDLVAQRDAKFGDD